MPKPNVVFRIKLNPGLVAPARAMHERSLVGEGRHSPNSFEDFLSDLTIVAIVERMRTPAPAIADRSTPTPIP